MTTAIKVDGAENPREIRHDLVMTFAPTEPRLALSNIVKHDSRQYDDHSSEACRFGFDGAHFLVVYDTVNTNDRLITDFR